MECIHRYGCKAGTTFLRYANQKHHHVTSVRAARELHVADGGSLPCQTCGTPIGEDRTGLGCMRCCRHGGPLPDFGEALQAWPGLGADTEEEIDATLTFLDSRSDASTNVAEKTLATLGALWIRKATRRIRKEQVGAACVGRCGEHTRYDAKAHADAPQLCHCSVVRQVGVLDARDLSAIDIRSCCDDRLHDSTSKANLRSLCKGRPPEEYIINLALRGRTTSAFWEKAHWRHDFCVSAEEAALKAAFFAQTLVLGGPVAGRFKSIERSLSRRLSSASSEAERTGLFHAVLHQAYAPALLLPLADMWLRRHQIMLRRSDLDWGGLLQDIRSVYGFGEVTTGELAMRLRHSPFFDAERDERGYTKMRGLEDHGYFGETGPTKALQLLLGISQEAHLEHAVKLRWSQRVADMANVYFPRRILGESVPRWESSDAQWTFCELSKDECALSGAGARESYPEPGLTRQPPLLRALPARHQQRARGTRRAALMKRPAAACASMKRKRPCDDARSRQARVAHEGSAPRCKYCHRADGVCQFTATDNRWYCSRSTCRTSSGNPRTFRAPPA